MRHNHNNVIGVDISDSSVKVLQLDSKYHITAYGNKQLRKGIVEDGTIIDIKALSDAFSEVLESTKPEALYTENNILRSSFCIPETKLYTHTLHAPHTIEKGEMKDYVHDQAQKIIPYALDEMYWDYDHAHTKYQPRATFVGASKVILDAYVDLFSEAHIKPRAVVGELFALGRALLPDSFMNEQYAILIIDIGARSTTVGFFVDGYVARVSVVIPIGGNYFTEKVAEKLSITIEEAEKLKRQYGLDVQHEETGVPAILQKCLMEIVTQVDEAKKYFESTIELPVMHSILAGGSALLPGIVQYMSEHTHIETKLGNPFLKIKNPEILGSDTPGVLFSNVIGLGLIGIDGDSNCINLLNQYRYEESSSEKELLRVRDIRTMSDVRYVLYGFAQTLKNLTGTVRGGIAEHVHVDIKLILYIFFLCFALAFLVWVVVSYT